MHNESAISGKNPHQTGRQLIILLGVTLVIKLLIMTVVIPELSKWLGSSYGMGFADDYDGLAEQLAQGHGYRFEPDTAPTMMREPGYPFFLAGIFWLFGHSLDAARMANVILGLVDAWLVAVVARRVSRDSIVVLGAPLMFLFHPGIIVAESRGGFEMLFILGLLLLTLAIYRAIEHPSLWRFVVSGFALGGVAVIRGTILLFPVFLLAYLLLTTTKHGERIKIIAKLGIMAAIMLIVMGPWIARNYGLVGQFIPTSTVQGAAAHAGQYICKHLDFDNGFQKLDSEAANERDKMAARQGYEYKGGYYQYFYRTEDEVDFNRYLLTKVIGEYLEEPWLFAKCASTNVFNFWFAGKSWRVTLVNMAVQLPFLILAMIGAWASYRDGRLRLVAPILVLIVYLMAVHVVVHAQARYSVPLIPFMSVLAALGIARLWDRLLTAEKRRA